MIPEQFLKLLADSLTDCHASRSEKTALKAWLEHNRPDPSLVQQMRTAAFAMAGSKIAENSPDAPAALAWL
ncbi:MAG: hypothetical protein ACOVRM_12295, partial [Planctomycetaceae bacterium]